MTEVAVVVGNGTVRTAGLVSHSGVELTVAVPEGLSRAGSQAVREVSAAVVRRSLSLVHGTKFQVGFWVVRVERQSAAQTASLWELVPETGDFEPSVLRTLQALVDQQDLCNQLSVPFSPPCIEQLAAVAPGISSGDIQAVRYPSPPHMSGWWITSETSSVAADMKPQHLSHVVAARPDIIRFLGLPFGYRFSLTSEGESEVWFDSEVASEPID